MESIEKYWKPLLCASCELDTNKKMPCEKCIALSEVYRNAGKYRLSSFYKSKAGQRPSNKDASVLVRGTHDMKKDSRYFHNRRQEVENICFSQIFKMATQSLRVTQSP